MSYVVRTKITPPGGYTYTQEETNVTMNANSWEGLLDQVAKHRRSNNLPVPFNLSDIVAKQLCERQPEACVKREIKHNPNSKLDLNVALRFTRTLMSAGLKRVDQQEADRRAEICASCPDNIEPQGCTPCRASVIKRVINLTVGDRQTTYDSELKSCKYCGCFNKAQVWFPLESLQKTITDAENQALPEHCWKKR